MSRRESALLTEGPALLERAVGYTRAALARVRPELLHAATPCADWDLAQLLTHMDDSLAAFTEAAEVGEVVSAPPAAGATDMVDRLRTRACALLGAWSVEPVRADVLVMGQATPSVLLAAAGAVEITVHGWDVAQACGEHHPVPDALARDLLTVVPWVVADADRPGRFRPAYEPRPGAAPGERLLAHLGRRKSTGGATEGCVSGW
jgi:uncharacterized protein (TIGR03086 family)